MRKRHSIIHPHSRVQHAGQKTRLLHPFHVSTCQHIRKQSRTDSINTIRRSDPSGGRRALCERSPVALAPPPVISATGVSVSVSASCLVFTARGDRAPLLWFLSSDQRKIKHTEKNDGLPGAVYTQQRKRTRGFGRYPSNGSDEWTCVLTTSGVKNTLFQGHGLIRHLLPRAWPSHMEDISCSETLLIQTGVWETHSTFIVDPPKAPNDRKRKLAIETARKPKC